MARLQEKLSIICFGLGQNCPTFFETRMVAFPVVTWSQIAKICIYQGVLWLEHVISLFRHSEINDRMKDGSPSLAGKAEDRPSFYVHGQL